MLAPEQINTYIAAQPDWQRKLLVRMRQLIHSADDRIEETWKGSAPCFELEDLTISTHALKTCVSVWFHKGSNLKDTHGLFLLSEKDAERELRKYKLFETDAINEKAFVDLVRQAVRRSGAKAKSAGSKTDSKSIELPAELEQVLLNDSDAMLCWKKLSASHKAEYVEWVMDANHDETRKRRIAQSLEMIREGRSKDETQKVG